MSRASNLKRKQKRKQSKLSSSYNVPSMSGESWSEIEVATTITHLFDELLNIGAVVSGKVFSIGSDNLDSQTRKSVMSTIELYSEATKKMEENTAWLGSVFEANEKTVQPPSRDAKMFAKTSEMIEYFKFVLARFNALLPKLESPSAVRPKEEVPLPSL